jgi:hypothetical protein
LGGGGAVSGIHGMLSGEEEVDAAEINCAIHGGLLNLAPFTEMRSAPWGAYGSTTSPGSNSPRPTACRKHLELRLRHVRAQKNLGVEKLGDVVKEGGPYVAC